MLNQAAHRANAAVRLICGGVGVILGFAAPAAGNILVQTEVRVYTMSPGRIGAIAAVVIGLIGAVIGRKALSAASRAPTDGRRGAIVSLILAPISLLIGGLVVVTADGGVGTGHGFGGGVVAMIVGLIGITLGGLALSRSHRAG